MVTVIVLVYVLLWKSSLGLVIKILATVIMSLEILGNAKKWSEQNPKIGKGEKLPLPTNKLRDLSVTSYGKQGAKDN